MDLLLVTQNGSDIHVACSGNLSQSEIPPRTDPLGEVIGPDGYAGTVYLNLSRSRFIDSSGMAWLLDRHKVFKAAGGKLVIHSVPPLIRQTLELLKLHKVLTIENEVPSHKAAAGGVE